MMPKMTSPRPERAGAANAADARTSAVDDLLRSAEELLREGHPAAALELLGRSRVHSPWLTNAAAVCQLRLGSARAAVDALRGLVLAGELFLRQYVPTVFKVNFATAL